MGGICSACGRPVAGADVMYAPDGRIICPRCFAAMDASTPQLSPPWRGFAIGGAIVGALPFFIHYSTSSSSSVNGQITSFVYRDYIAIGCGAVVALLAIATVFAARKERVRRAIACAAGFGVLALGGYQIANGLGVFATPGSADVSSSVSFETVQMKAAAGSAAPALDPNDPATCAEMEACFQLGLELDDKHDPHAVTAFERACDKGGPGGCLNAGTAYIQAKDPAKGVALYKKGCDLKSADACTQYARGLRDGTGVDKNPEEAKTVFDKSCTAGYMLACTDLAKMYDLGQGIPADKAKALELFEKVCDHDEAPEHGFECGLAGTALHDGKPTKAQAKLGASYLEKACSRADKYCYFFAMANETGWGVAKDLKKARSLYEKACGAQHPDACNNLGTMQELGKGGKKDKIGAKVSYKEACELKLPAGCKNQKRLK